MTDPQDIFTETEHREYGICNLKELSHEMDLAFDPSRETVP